MTTPPPERKPLSPIPRTIIYFTMWGLDYGFIFGFAAGSMVIPVFGTIIGSFLGLFLGGLYGLIAGLGMSALHKSITPETDLDAYGQTLVRRTAATLTLLNVVAVPLVLTSIFNSLSTSDLLYRNFPNENIFIAGAGAFCVLISLVVAATARHYPHWMAHQRPLTAPMSHAFLMRHEMETAFQQIRKRSARWWIPGLVVGVASVIFLMDPARYQDYTAYEWFIMLVFGAAWSSVGVWIGRIYLSLVNAAALTFLKRVILRDYFPNLIGARYRSRVTVIAFFVTLAASWWTFFVAPLLALLMAYFVYHTVALPDEMQEKSKRKEVDASSKAKVNPALMLLEETDGEIIDLHHLTDPSSIQAQQS